MESITLESCDFKGLNHSFWLIGGRFLLSLTISIIAESKVFKHICLALFFSLHSQLVHFTQTTPDLPDTETQYGSLGKR